MLGRVDEQEACVRQGRRPESDLLLSEKDTSRIDKNRAGLLVIGNKETAIAQGGAKEKVIVPSGAVPCPNERACVSIPSKNRRRGNRDYDIR